MNAQELFVLAMKYIYGDGVQEDNGLAVKLLTQAQDILSQRHAAGIFCKDTIAC